VSVVNAASPRGVNSIATTGCLVDASSAAVALSISALVSAGVPPREAPAL
jgi:hypothetical protein